MRNGQGREWCRREFLSAVGLAGTSACWAAVRTVARRAAAGDDAAQNSQVCSTCRSPEWVAEELLRAEGFTDVQYLPTKAEPGVARRSRPGERTSAALCGAGDPAHRGG
jgi:NitT/TauT family transport system substrate-binding protein